MKKFCNKLKNQQWHLPLPSPNPLLRRSFHKTATPDPGSGPPDSCTGSYDLELARREFDRNYDNLTHSDVADFDSTDSEKYEDARTAQDTSMESEIYADVSSASHETSKNLSDTNSQFEYDVPKISFSFFDLTREMEIRRKEEDGDEEVREKHKSEIVIVLAEPEPELEEAEEFQTEAIVEERTFEVCITKSLENFPVQPLMKCGSDPNVFMRHTTTTPNSEDDEDEALYKVPRQIKLQHRLSKSLDDFSVENLDTITSAHSSIEHISCSQVNVQKTSETNRTSENSLDYCKTRSNLPLKTRRVTLLRKPKAKAVDTWINFRTKFNNLMTEQAAQQRVGAFEGKEKSPPIRIEDIYKNSKDKCRKVIRNTGKLFKKKSTHEDDKISDTSSQIIKNHAFFAKVNLKASDIEYKLNYSPENKGEIKEEVKEVSEIPQVKPPVITRTISEEKREEFDFNTIKSAFRRSKIYHEGQNGFEDLRRYVKQGGDFCKELAVILQERSEAETQYAKSLSKLSLKLSKACRDGVGDLNEAWRAVATELEARAEGHRVVGAALLEEAARPLRTLTENQHRLRKQTETVVDKAARSLADWRAAEAKSKKQSHSCARDNEKLQDVGVDAGKIGKMTLSRSTSLIHLSQNHNKPNTDKENAKIEGKKRKAENAVKKADIEYYTLCVRAERARLEWESAVLRGASTFQSLEEERLNNLKSVLASYLKLSEQICPTLTEAVDRLKPPINQAEPTRDLCTFINLRQSSQQISEQLLPDFYCEHITLAMNKERRKQALVKLIHLIRQDIERERKSKNGLENLSKAIKQNPSFGVEDSQQSVSEKLYHMKSMLTYLEGARYKVQSALAELDSRPRNGHPLAAHITITRDKTGLQQSVLKVPQWLRDGWIDTETSPMSEKSDKSNVHFNEAELTEPEWTDRGNADGNSNQPDSDFDEFSSQSSTTDERTPEEHTMQPVAKCRALYMYTPNLPDELTLRPGDVLSVYRQQDDGWWLGECNGSVGIFPATYVETI